jgi:PTS system fructose-specific IIC component/PTS system nitrogen regulatory IIA component
MRLSRIFDTQSIITLKSTQKFSAFEELVDVIMRVHPQINKDEALTVLKKRELKMTTGILRGIAIPHAEYAGTDEIIGAVGFSEQGIEYGSIDNIPVRIVFLVLTNPNNRPLALKFFGKLAAFLDSAENISAILENQTPCGVLELLH